MIWTIIEPGLGITAASMVKLRPLLRALNIHGFTSDTSSGPYARGPHDSAAPRTNLRDSEIGAYLSREPTSREVTSMRASSGAMTTTSTIVIGGGREPRKGSVSMQTYSTSGTGSQELMLAHFGVSGVSPAGRSWSGDGDELRN